MYRLPPRDTRRLVPLAAIVLLCGCSKSATLKTEPIKPAKIEKLPAETELATITLTPDADRRLGIRTVEVQMREVVQRRTLGGVVMVPLGRSIIVTAPLPGIVTRSGSKTIPTPGSIVKKNDAPLSLTPLLSAERDVPTPGEQVQLINARATLIAAQTVAAGDVQRGKAEVEGAKIAFDRAKQLFADRAGAKRAVDDTEALLNIAAANLDAAQQRDDQLKSLIGTLETPTVDGTASTIAMRTPIGGFVNRLEVSEGQTVAAGAMLFEVVNTDTVWIRVAVFVDLLPTIQIDAPGKLKSLSGDSMPTDIEAKPVIAPPTADAMTSSVDLYFEVDNRTVGLRPGQRVGVELQTSPQENRLIVPAASVLYDIHGNAWVYTRTSDLHYSRSRIEVQFVNGDEAILASGPELGSAVVVEGAAELFGTEFGAGK